jgi:hypothetical protein
MARLEALRDAVAQAKDSYWTEPAEIQREGDECPGGQSGGTAEALLTMRVAANLEDRGEEHEAFLENRFRRSTVPPKALSTPATPCAPASTTRSSSPWAPAPTPQARSSRPPPLSGEPIDAPA